MKQHLHHPLASGVRAPRPSGVPSSSPSVELMPGDVALARAGDTLRTLLGSCVSVVLTDPRRTVAAMCHIVHVGRPNTHNRHNTAYGEVAMHDMFRRLTAVAIAPQRCEAFVYGGGNMFPGIAEGPLVGERNVQWVLAFLHAQGIAVVDQDVGGCTYRKVSWQVGRDLPHVDPVSVEQGGAT